jgi:hypothetical protein
MKETVVVYSKPATNVMEYSLELRGLQVSAPAGGPSSAPTPGPQLDGSLALNDHDGRTVFNIPWPTLRDARGSRGTASYRYTAPTGGRADGKLELVLDAAWLSTAAYPIEIDPGIVTAAGLVENAAAPWQRQAVTAVDGTMAYGFYDTTSGSTGIKLATSTDNWTSVANTTTIAAGLGAGGFSLEIDQATDKILVALTGTVGSTNVLRIVPLSYNPTTKLWSPGTAMDVQSSTTLQWSGASLVIERGATDYVWVGADERDTANKYTYRSYYATLASVLAGTPTWTTLSPAFLALTTYAHFTGLVAITGGIAAVGRDVGRQKGAVYTRSTNTWGALDTLSGEAFPDAKEFALLAVADPLSPGTASLVPMAAVPEDDGDTNRNAIALYVRRYGATTWTKVTLPGVLSADAQPALSTPDGGASFYVWRLKKNSTTNWQINGHRGRLATDPAAPPSVEIGPDRVWIIEPVDKNLKALNVPRTLGTEVMPWFYIKDLAADQLVVQTQRVDLLGDRNVWNYKEFKIPGAGTAKVNLANGNLHYEMVDADMPSRKWNDILKRAYESQSSIKHEYGPRLDQRGHAEAEVLRQPEPADHLHRQEQGRGEGRVLERLRRQVRLPQRRRHLLEVRAGHEDGAVQERSFHQQDLDIDRSLRTDPLLRQLRQADHQGGPGRAQQRRLDLELQRPERREHPGRHRPQPVLHAGRQRAGDEGQDRPGGHHRSELHGHHADRELPHLRVCLRCQRATPVGHAGY